MSAGSRGLRHLRSTVSGNNKMAEAVQLTERDFTPTFTVERMLKDLGLILGAGETSHVPLPHTAMTYQLMQLPWPRGDGRQDYAAIIKPVEPRAGVDAAAVAGA